MGPSNRPACAHSDREPTAPLDSAQLAIRAARLALEKKAHDVLVLDLRGLTSAADRFVVCSGDSETQVKAIADHIATKLGENGSKPWHVEGLEGRRWVLLDFVDVVVHVFYGDTRAFYGLETLWGDAPTERVDDDAREIA
jgi:ribosome-associated protein